MIGDVQNRDAYGKIKKCDKMLGPTRSLFFYQALFIQKVTNASNLPAYCGKR